MAQYIIDITSASGLNDINNVILPAPGVGMVNVVDKFIFIYLRGNSSNHFVVTPGTQFFITYGLQGGFDRFMAVDCYALLTQPDSAISEATNTSLSAIMTTYLNNMPICMGASQTVSGSGDSVRVITIYDTIKVTQ